MTRTSHLAFSTLLAITTLAIYVIAFVLQTRVGSLPPDFARDKLAYPVRIDGIQVGSPDDLRFVAEGFSPGEPVTIVDATGGRHHTTTAGRRDIAYLVIVAISGLFFWSVATFIFAPRMDRPGARIFYWLAYLYGLSVAIGGIYFVGDRSWLSYAMGYTQLTILGVVPLLFIRLGLTFPDRSRFLDRVRWLMPTLTGLTVLVVGWEVVAFHHYFIHPGLHSAGQLDLPQVVADGVLVAETAFGFALLTARGLRAQDEPTRRQVLWLLLGFTVGSAPYVFFRTLPSIFGTSLPIPPHVDRIFEMAIPLVFVLVVVRHRFLDIDVILRRGLMYTTIAGATIVAYLLLGLALSGYIEARVSGRAGVLLLLVGLAAGLLFRPLRGWIRARVDRTFFKLTYDYDRAVRDMRAAVGHVGGQHELAKVVARRLGHTIHATTVGVVLREGAECRVAGDLPPDAAVPAFRLFSTRGGSLPNGTIADRGSTGVPQCETADFPRILADQGVVLATPVCDDTGLMGLIMVGPRRTKRRYIDRDLGFLDACADAVAAALSRMELVQAVSAEAFERRRLSELNRHKTEYLARVSHDLRTPLTSIAWASQNLTDGVIGELNEQQIRYVASIRVAASHLSRLVTNLVTISRIDEEHGHPDLEAIHLRDVIHEALGMLRPIAQQSGVTFVFDGGGGPLVAGNARCLQEIVTNVLDNAVRFSPPGSTVEIRCGEQDGEDVVVRVRDHGPGIDAAIIGTMFDRHTQGARSPYTSRQGFGLGLHIVKSYIEQMGGGVEGANHPDGGAVFTLRFARWHASREVGA